MPILCLCIICDLATLLLREQEVVAEAKTLLAAQLANIWPFGV